LRQAYDYWQDQPGNYRQAISPHPHPGPPRAPPPPPHPPTPKGEEEEKKQQRQQEHEQRERDCRPIFFKKKKFEKKAASVFFFSFFFLFKRVGLKPEMVEQLGRRSEFLAKDPRGEPGALQRGALQLPSSFSHFP